MRFILILTVFVSVYINAQPVLEWSNVYGDAAICNAIDSHDNLIVAGYFGRNNDMDPSPDTYTISPCCIYISKLSSDSKLIWAKAIGGGGDNKVCSVATDKEDCVYIVGLTDGSADLDPGPEVFIIPSDQSSIITFLCKLDPSGNFLWAKAFERFYYGNKVVTDPFNNVLVATSSSWGAYIYKTDPFGNPIWTRNWKTGINTQSMISDKIGNLYVTGAFSDSVDFDPGPAQFKMYSNGAMDIFVLKMNQTGDFVWANKIGANADDNATAITIDEGSNLLFTGYCSNTVDFDPGPGTYTLASNGWFDAFICKMDTSGNFIWAKRFGGRDDDIATDISSDKLGNVYITGTFSDVVDFDPGPGSHTLDAAQGPVFVSKFSSAGNFWWTTAFNFHSSPIGPSIVTSTCGSVFFAGTAKPEQWVPNGLIAKIDSCTLITGLQEISSNDLSIYPNPSNGIFEINIGNNNMLTKNSLKIKNIYGQDISDIRLHANEIDLSGLTKGIYFIEISENAQTIRKKIIIE